jgi:hypothetical protein
MVNKHKEQQMELISTKTRFDTAEDAVDSILNEKVAIALGHKFIHVYPTGANITEVNGKQTNFQPTLDKATAFDLMIAQGLRISVGYDQRDPNRVRCEVPFTDIAFERTFASDGSNKVAQTCRVICEAIVAKYEI